jgi:hypothetical protein
MEEDDKIKHDLNAEHIEFAGSAYSADSDKERLAADMYRVFMFMRDGQWYTIKEISEGTGCPESSVSGQIGNLRLARHGGHVIDRRLRGKRGSGHFEYRLEPSGVNPLDRKCGDSRIKELQRRFDLAEHDRKQAYFAYVAVRDRRDDSLRELKTAMREFKGQAGQAGQSA